MNPSDESWFRTAFGISWVAFMALRIHFMRKMVGIERIQERRARRTRFLFRLLSLTYLMMVPYMFTAWLDFAHIPLPHWMRWGIGGGSMVFSLGLFFWCHSTLGRNWSGLLEIYRNHVLITHGPYRRIRHPMYTAFFLSAIGFSFLSANGFIAVFHVGAVVLMYADRVEEEETMMAEHFGDAYRQHMETTGRLFPRLRLQDPKGMMKSLLLLLGLVGAGLAITAPACKQTTTEPNQNGNINFPVTTNALNSFTYTVLARQFSENAIHTLNFTSDSLVITVTSFDYTGGYARFEVFDSMMTSIFVDTVRSNTVDVLVNDKTTVPKRCSIHLSQFSGELSFVLVGEG